MYTVGHHTRHAPLQQSLPVRGARRASRRAWPWSPSASCRVSCWGCLAQLMAPRWRRRRRHETSGLFHWNVHVIPMIFPWRGRGRNGSICLYNGKERFVNYFCAVGNFDCDFWGTSWFVACLLHWLSAMDIISKTLGFDGDFREQSGSPGAWSCGQGGRRGLWCMAASSSQSERSHIQNIESP